MKRKTKAGLVVVLFLLALLAGHRSALHQVMAVLWYTGLAAASLMALLAVVVLVKTRPARAVTRPRPAAQPAVITRPRAVPPPGRPYGSCGCGQPAVTRAGSQPRCGRHAADWMAAQPAAVDPAGQVEVTEVRQRPAGPDEELPLPALAQPPVIPRGETIGQVDMTKFEKGLRND